MDGSSDQQRAAAAAHAEPRDPDAESDAFPDALADRMTPLIRAAMFEAAAVAIEGYAHGQRVRPPPGAPPMGADADIWILWRIEEKRAGRWWKLREIEDWSGFSLSKLKRKSSERKPRGTPKPSLEKQKKFG